MNCKQTGGEWKNASEEVVAHGNMNIILGMHIVWNGCTTNPQYGRIGIQYFTEIIHRRWLHIMGLSIITLDLLRRGEHQNQNLRDNHNLDIILEGDKHY